MLYAVNIADLADLLTDASPLVVGCYSDWCPASSQSKPVFEDVATRHADTLRFCKVRTDMSEDIAAALRVTSIPSFYLLVGGGLVDVLRGAVPAPVLERWILDNLTAPGQQAAVAG